MKKGLLKKHLEKCSGRMNIFCKLFGHKARTNRVATGELIDESCARNRCSFKVAYRPHEMKGIIAAQEVVNSPKPKHNPEYITSNQVLAGFPNDVRFTEACKRIKAPKIRCATFSETDGEYELTEINNTLEECNKLASEMGALNKELIAMREAPDFKPDFDILKDEKHKPYDALELGHKGEPIPKRPKVASTIESEAQADFKKALIKKGHSEASANCELDRFNHLFSAWSLELAEGKNDT